MNGGCFTLKRRKYTIPDREDFSLKLRILLDHFFILSVGMISIGIITTSIVGPSV